jgi:hypothetical protein
MRLPYKSEDLLSDALSSCSEVVLSDYYRRLDLATTSAQGAHLAVDMSKAMEQRILDTHSKIKKTNLIAISAILLAGLATLVFDIQNGKTATLFAVLAWTAYLGALEIYTLPHLADQKSKYWNEYQMHAIVWRSAVGSNGFSEHMGLSRTEFHGDINDDADTVNLAIRGFALNQALRISRNER